MFIGLALPSALKSKFLKLHTSPPQSAQKLLPPMATTYTRSMGATGSTVHASVESQNNSESTVSEDDVFTRFTERKISTDGDGKICQNISYRRQGKVHQFISEPVDGNYLVTVSVTKTTNLRNVKQEDYWRHAGFRATMAWTREEQPLVEMLQRRVLQAIDEISIQPNLVFKELDPTRWRK